MYTVFMSHMLATYPSHLTLSDLTTVLTIFREKYEYKHGVPHYVIFPILLLLTLS